jgi:integrase/recombinase XerC
MTNTLATIGTTEIITESAATKINELAQEWLAFVDVQPTTFVTYNRAMKNFTRWLAENNIATVDRAAVISYRDSLLKKLQPSTCRLYVACVKLFIKFLASKGICPDFTAHFKGVKLSNDTHSRDALTADESKELFHSMKGSDEKSLRDKAIVGLMLATGLRCVEVTRLDVEDVEKRGKKFFLKIHGKARQGKQDRVILPAQCATLIQAYLKVRGNVSGNEPLFVSTSCRCKGNRLQSQSISRMCKKNLVNAGFDSPRLTAHSLRHSFATHALTAGVNIRQVSKALRHKSITVTEIYAHDLDAMSNTATATVANLIF